MRVLMTADGVGGVFGFVVDLARELGPHGVSVTVAMMGPALRREQRTLLQSLPNVDLHERPYALEWMREPWDAVDAASEWLLDLARGVRPDVVHVNGYSHALLDFGAPKLLVAHSCVLGWWRAVHGTDAPDTYREYARRVRAALAAADLVVAPTRAMLDTLGEEYGFRGGHVIPNGVDPERYFPAEKLPQFAAAGRLWDPAKNLELIVRALPLLPWQVRVAGPPPKPSVLPPGIEALGVLARAELGRLLARSAVFLHPARYEPFGLAVLEAAAAGSALVLGDIRSLREVWDDAALYVPVDDPEALGAAATRLANDGDLRLSLARRARERARRYTAAATAAEYLLAYAKLTSRADLRAATNRAFFGEAPSFARHGKEGRA